MKFFPVMLIILISFSANAILPKSGNSGDIIINTFTEYIHVSFDGSRLTERTRHVGENGSWFPQVSMNPTSREIINTQQILPAPGVLSSLLRPKSGIKLNGLENNFLEDTRDGFTYFDFYKGKIILDTNLVFNDDNNSQSYPSIFKKGTIYSNVVIVDLDSLKVERRLPIGIVKALQVVGDHLYTISSKGDVLRTNLNTYEVKKLNVEPIDWMFPTFVVTSDEQVFLATTQHKYENKPTKLKPSRLYKLGEGVITEVAKIPSEHLRNRVFESNGQLNFLLDNGELWSVDLATGKSRTHKLPFKSRKLRDSFFVKLSEDLFVFSERGLETTRLFVTDSRLKLLAEHDFVLSGGGMQWNLSTREQPYGNQKL